MFNPRDLLSDASRLRVRQGAKVMQALLDGESRGGDRVYKDAMSFGPDDEEGFLVKGSCGNERWKILMDAHAWVTRKAQNTPQDKGVVTVVGVCVGGINRSGLAAGFLKAHTQRTLLSVDDPLLESMNDLNRAALASDTAPRGAESVASLSKIDATYAAFVRNASRKRIREGSTSA